MKAGLRKVIIECGRRMFYRHLSIAYLVAKHLYYDLSETVVDDQTFDSLERVLKTYETTNGVPAEDRTTNVVDSAPHKWFNGNTFMNWCSDPKILAKIETSYDEGTAPSPLVVGTELEFEDIGVCEIIYNSYGQVVAIDLQGMPHIFKEKDITLE